MSDCIKVSPRLCRGTHRVLQFRESVCAAPSALNNSGLLLTPASRGRPTVGLKASAKGAFYTSLGQRPRKQSAVQQKGCKPAPFSIMERAFSPCVLKEPVFLGRCPRLVWIGPPALPRRRGESLRSHKCAKTYAALYIS